MALPHNYTKAGNALLASGNDRLRELIGAISTSVGASMVTFNNANQPTTEQWMEAALVLITQDMVNAIAHSGVRFPRRDGVVLVGDNLDDPAVWRQAVEIGAEHVVVLPDALAWLEDRLRNASGDEMYCRVCQLPESNSLHHPVKFYAEAYDDVRRLVEQVHAKAANAALDSLNAMALECNSQAHYVGFEYVNTYFGHGQTGPVVQSIYLYDAAGLPLRLVDSDDEQENEFDEDYMLSAWITYTDNEVEMDDTTTYRLDLHHGTVSDQTDGFGVPEGVQLQAWPDPTD